LKARYSRSQSQFRSCAWSEGCCFSRSPGSHDTELGEAPGSARPVAWFEAYIGGRWRTFDARNNIPRIGRVLIARGRDATDVAISNTFGPNTLAGFTIWTDEVRSSLEKAGFGNSAGTTCAF
jgi:transglutaminase-like putative cysteine protease